MGRPPLYFAFLPSGIHSLRSKNLGENYTLEGGWCFWNFVGGEIVTRMVGGRKEISGHL